MDVVNMPSKKKAFDDAYISLIVPNLASSARTDFIIRVTKDNVQHDVDTFNKMLHCAQKIE
eukprot:scaffold239394_cov15-Prasinocladus_malaysianus.AAC.1